MSIQGKFQRYCQGRFKNRFKALYSALTTILRAGADVSEGSVKREPPLHNGYMNVDLTIVPYKYNNIVTMGSTSRLMLYFRGCHPAAISFSSAPLSHPTLEVEQK